MGNSTSENNTFDVSVLVLTYHIDYKKLYATLKSILVQKDISFQIIVADDSSKNFDREEIEAWFTANGFYHYHVVSLPYNMGTVQNVNNGLKYVSGKYLKLISPGDFLYDDKTLSKFFAFCERNESEVCFGDAIYYAWDGNECKIYDHLRTPTLIKPYKKNHLKRMIYNYLILGDIIISPAYFIRTSIFVKYFSLVVDKVKFVEDAACMLMVADGIRFHYYANPIIWYEYGTGISTSGNSEWESKITHDLLIVGDMLESKNKKYKIFNQMRRKEKNLRVFFLRLRRKLLFRLARSFTKVDYAIENLKNILGSESEDEN